MGLRLALALAVLLACGWLAGRPPAGHAQTLPPEPPTEAPPVPTEAPPAPTAVPTAAPARPAEREEDEEEPPPPAQGAAETPTAAPATRTRRPTRTPRTTPTLTPVPFEVGALRLTLAAEPGAGQSGQDVVLQVALANRAAVPALGSTLEISLPDGLTLQRVEAVSGQTLQDGPLVRWYVPRLDPEAETSLRLTGLPAQAGERSLRLCVLLLSAGSPVEHCGLFRLGGLGGERSAPPTEPLDVPTMAPPGGAVPDELWPRVAGWGLLALGLGVLGIWLGVQARGARASRP